MQILRTVLFILCLPISLADAQENESQALKLIEMKDYTGARKLLEMIVNRDKQNAEAHFRLGVLLINQFRDYDAAEERLERAVELADNNAEYHFVLGRLYGIQAQVSGIFSKLSYAGKAKSEFIRAVELMPQSLPYRFALMNYYLQAPGIAGGSVAKAEEQATVILGIDASEGHIARAQIAAYDKDDPAVEKHYRDAIAANPGKGRAHNLLGYFYLRQRRVDDAIAQFRLCLELEPNDPNSYDSLAEGLLERGTIEEALEHYTKALSLNSEFAPSVYGKARCLEAKGMKSEALTDYRRYLSLNPLGGNAETAKRKVKELAE